MNGAEIAHKLKVYGNGSEWNGVINVFNTGIGVGVGATLLTGTAFYLTHRLVKWGREKCKNISSNSAHLVITIAEQPTTI